MQDKFLILPNNLVWNYWDRDNTYLKQYGDKIIHIFSYLQSNTTLLCQINFTIEDLILSCGLTPKTGKGKTNEQFKNILEDLKLRNILKININFDFTKAKIDKLIKLELNIPFEHDAEGNKVQFFTVGIHDYLKIMKYDGGLDKLILLKIFYYINARISRRKNDDISYINDDNRMIRVKNIIITGGKAECFYDNYSHISKDLKISEDTFKKYIKELNKLGLLFYDNIGIVQDKSGKKHTANNVYCVCKNELEEGLKQSKLYYKDQGYKILDVQNAKENREINGLKGKIQQQKNLNKEVSELERKLNKLENKMVNPF
ncbi:hypothetical protein [Clostridium novyi]|uniref:hypothetical protein n=1 Tax=Clostridium novyi TaxID=1542 RepID=UPI00069F5B8D|nr:hypothetical protein [Clostridium novyi]